MINVALRQAVAQPMTPVTLHQSDHTSIHHLHDTLPQTPSERNLPHLFLFPSAWMEAGERRKPGVEAALG